MIRQQPYASPGEALEALGSLEHHGVKGMKWGVRKDEQTGGGKAGVDPVTAAIGAAYVGIFLAAAYKTVRDIRRYKTDSGEHIQKQNANVPWKKKVDLAKKAPPMTVATLQSKIVKQVNPEFPNAGTKMNCRRCTFAYEMRRRGYDVTSTKSHFALGQDLEGLQTATMAGAKKHYESVWGEKQVAPPHEFARQTPQRKSELIFESLGKYPNGARGELAVGWNFGGGHSMAFEVVNKKPVIFDTQNGVTYKSPAAFAKYTPITGVAAHTRTDNVTLDEQFLRRWMVNA